MNEGIFYHIISFCLGSSSSPLPVLCTFILVTIVCFLAVLKLQFYKLYISASLSIFGSLSMFSSISLSLSSSTVVSFCVILTFSVLCILVAFFPLV